MKPPVRVWVVIDKKGNAVDVDVDPEKATVFVNGDTLHRYRLDTPKPLVQPSLPVAGGVVRKKRKAKRGRK